jgi:hypothetical protein
MAGFVSPSAGAVADRADSQDAEVDRMGEETTS